MLLLSNPMLVKARVPGGSSLMPRLPLCAKAKSSADLVQLAQRFEREQAPQVLNLYG